MVAPPLGGPFPGGADSWVFFCRAEHFRERTSEQTHRGPPLTSPTFLRGAGSPKPCSSYWFSTHFACRRGYRVFLESPSPRFATGVTVFGVFPWSAVHSEAIPRKRALPTLCMRRARRSSAPIVEAWMRRVRRVGPELKARAWRGALGVAG